MGQTLSEPVTEKQSSTCQDSRYLVGSSCMQGWRVSMDDSHTHILSLPEDPGTAYFAVYDGHGGSNIAEYAGKHLHKFITARPEYHLGNIEEALKQGFLDLDQAMLEEDMLQEKVAGSTAVVVLIKDNTLYCANVGDSRSIASVRGGVEVLSYDHKPNNEEELRRITAGGGWVQLNRVNGNLALSRALGDYVFKRNYRLSPQEQIVTAFPDVQVRQLNDDWEFIVIACDGIWEVLSNEEVISFCRVRLLSGWEPAAVCEALMQRCLAPNCATGGLGCDNMTVLIICLAPFPRIDPANSPKLPQEDSIEFAKFPAKNELKELKNEFNESLEKNDSSVEKGNDIALDSNVGDVSKRLMTPEQPKVPSRRSKVDDPNFVQNYKDALSQMEESFDNWKAFFLNYPTSRNLKVMHKFRKTLNNVLRDQEALNLMYNNHEKRLSGKVCVPLSGVPKNVVKNKKNKTKTRRQSVRQTTDIERKTARIHKKK